MSFVKRDFAVAAAVAAAMTVLAGLALAVEPGVYSVLGSPEFVLSRKHAVGIEDLGKIREVGVWNLREFGGAGYVVLETWRNREFAEYRDPTVWVFEETKTGINLRGCGSGPLEDVLARFAGDEKPKAAKLELRISEKPLEAAVEQRVDDAAASFLRRRKAYLDEVAVEEFGKSLMDNPDRVAEVRLEYPELYPEEDRPDVWGMAALYPARMQKVFDVLGSRDVKFSESSLVSLLDRVDWEKGDFLAFMILGRPELTSGTLRAMAQKVFARFGKSDDGIVSIYFRNGNTPLDVLEKARKVGGYGSITAGVIDKRLKGGRK